MVYWKIRQPAPWAQWVMNRVNKAKTGVLKNCQAFIKYGQITRENEGKFGGSTTMIMDDIVAMIATKDCKQQPKPSPSDALTDSSKTTTTKQLPPFVKHTKTSLDSEGAPYVPGNMKTWKGDTYHYCEYPNHKREAHWHQHTCNDCCTLPNWLKQQGKTFVAANPIAIGNLASKTNKTDTMDVTDTASTQGDNASQNILALTDTSPILALLAQAYNMAEYGAEKDAIAKIMNSM